MSASRELRQSASVVMTRVGPDARVEVYLVERSPKLRFLGGFWAFPGGVIDACDHEFGEAARACALRELFEETGVLPRALAQQFGDEERDRAREVMLHRDGSADRFVAALRARPAAMDGLEELGSITTPPFAPRRYRNRFYHFELPTSEWPSVKDGELVDGRFVEAGEALRLWLEGEMRIAPPVLLLLRMLDRHGPAGFYEAVRRETAELEAGKLHPASFSPGVLAFPLRTETIPPATTTNCYVVGKRRLFVIDPASACEEEQARLANKLDELCVDGAELGGVIVTHHHPDHIGGVATLAERYGLAVHAHPRTLERLGLGESVRTVAIDDGDRLELGLAPDGAEDWHLRALFTPGHDQGHLAFVESRYHAAIVGDLLSTVSTIVIDPPEGHLATYLDSLRRLLSEELSTLYPAHGPAATNGRKLVRHYLEHRVEREEQLVRALAAAPGAKASELVPAVYAQTPEAMWPFAERSLLAGLHKLEEEGRAERRGDGWVAL